MSAQNANKQSESGVSKQVEVDSSQNTSQLNIKAQESRTTDTIELTKSVRSYQPQQQLNQECDTQENNGNNQKSRATQFQDSTKQEKQLDINNNDNDNDNNARKQVETSRKVEQEAVVDTCPVCDNAEHSFNQTDNYNIPAIRQSEPLIQTSELYNQYQMQRNASAKEALNKESIMIQPTKNKLLPPKEPRRKFPFFNRQSNNANNDKEKQQSGNAQNHNNSVHGANDKRDSQGQGYLKFKSFTKKGQIMTNQQNQQPDKHGQYPPQLPFTQFTQQQSFMNGMAKQQSFTHQINGHYPPQIAIVPFNQGLQGKNLYPQYFPISCFTHQGPQSPPISGMSQQMFIHPFHNQYMNQPMTQNISLTAAATIYNQAQLPPNKPFFWWPGYPQIFGMFKSQTNQQQFAPQASMNGVTFQQPPFPPAPIHMNYGFQNGYTNQGCIAEADNSNKLDKFFDSCFQIDEVWNTLQASQTKVGG